MSDADKTQSRRSFITSSLAAGAGAFVTASLLPNMALAILDDKKKVIATVKISDHKELQEVGGNILLEDTPVGDILIIRSGKDKFSVMSNICPHKKCKVKVKGDDKIECPCHRSRYTLEGEYKYGPSKKDLKRFPFEIKDNTLTVSGS